jgi:protein SCO1/2
LYLATAALTLFVLWFAIARPIQVLPRIRTITPFTLTDQTSHWLSDRDLRSKVILISFGYANCGLDCADLETRLMHVRDQLRGAGLLGKPAQLLTISVDPAHDRPSILQAYATRLGAQPSEWLLLTGAPPDVKQVVGGEFGIYYTQEAGSTAISFDRRAVLIDGEGIVRAEYDAKQLDPATVVRDVVLIERESSSAAIERPIYEAAHVFVCYPRT